MTKKKILSLLLALIIVFSTVSPSYASLYDYYYKDNIENNEKDYSLSKVALNQKIFIKVALNLDKYYQQGFDNKYYLAKDISDYEYDHRNASAEEIYANIPAYIKTDDYSIIDTSLIKYQSEFEESHYTEASWAAYKAAREDLLALKELRFVKETLVLEKVSALELAYKNLKAKTNTDELERKLAEAKSYNLRDYTQETADALSQAIKEAEYLLASNRITEKAVQIAIKDLDEKINALEKNYDLYPVEVLAIPDINLELGQELKLPQTVIVKMSDNSHVERRVGWNTREVFVNTPGRYEASTSVYFYNPGSYETAKRYNFDVSVFINVLDEKTTDKTDLVKAIENGQAFSPNKYSEYSYRDLREALERGLAVNNDINSSQDQIDQAEQDIKDAIARLKEEQPKDRIIYVIQPQFLRLKQGDAFVMPKTVKVVLNSGVEVEKPVIWSENITTEELGEFTVYGTIEGTNEKARLTIEVIEGPKQADKTLLQNLVDKAKALDTTNKTPDSLKRLANEISNAENVLALANPSQDLIDKAYADLEKAIKDLEDNPSPADLTIIEPSGNLEVSQGQKVQIKVQAPSGGKVGYKIALDGSFNTVPIDANMEETEPGTYTVTWTVPQGLNASNLKVFVSHTDDSGFTSFAETEGIISIVQKLTVTYNIDGEETKETVKRGSKPTDVPQSEKKGYEIKWTNESGHVVDPKNVEIHEDTIFSGSYKEIEGAWADLVFKLPSSDLKFAEGQITSYRVLKSETLVAQDVKIPKVDPTNIKAGLKPHWDLDLNQAINKDTEVIAELVKDDSQYTVFDLVVGENGSLKDPAESTLEVLTETADKEIIDLAEDKVKANDYYQIGEIEVNREKEEITINFVEDPNYWVDVIFKDHEGKEIKHHVHINQTYEQAGITLPDIKVEEGKKVIWDPEFSAEKLIEKPAGSNQIVFQASIEKDDDAFTTYNIVLDTTNGKGSYVEDNNKTLEILKTASDDKIEEEAKKLVTADENYKISEVTIDKETKEITIAFAKDAEKWIDITITKSENGNIKLDGTVQDLIELNVPIGTKLSDLMTEETTEFFVEDSPSPGYKWEAVDHEFTAENPSFEFKFEKDLSKWKEIKFIAGENGSFEGTKEREISTSVVINTTFPTEIIPTPKADPGYKLTGWPKSFPQEVTEDLSYTANFEKDPNQWTSVKFLLGNDLGKWEDGSTNEFEAIIGQSFEYNGIEIPKAIANKGYKAVWTEEPSAETSVVKDMTYTVNFEKDDDQWVTLTFEAGENGRLEGLLTQEVLKGAAWADVNVPTTIGSPGFNFEKWDPVLPTTVPEINTTYTASFIKDESKYATISFVLGSGGEFGSFTPVEPQEVLKGSPWSEIKLPEVKANPGYKVEYSPELPKETDEINNTQEYKVSFVKDESMWHNVTFTAGENGSFKDTAQKSIIKNGLQGTEIADLPRPKADEGYEFTGWKPEITDNKVIIPENDIEYKAIFEPLSNLSYTISHIQVDENNQPYRNSKGEIIKIKDDTVVGDQIFGKTITVNALELENFDLLDEGNQEITIQMDSSKNIVEFRYKVKADSAEIIKNQVAADAEVKVPNVKSQVEGISFDFDKEKRIVYFNFDNPGGNAIEDLMASLGGSGIFATIASLEGIQKVSFGNTSIEFYDKNGNKKDANAIKNEMIANSGQIIAAFNIDENEEDQAKYSITANWHGINAKPVAEEMGKVSEETIVTEDTYTFMFNITDRKVVFDADGKGEFDFTEKTLPYREPLGEGNIPNFTQAANYIFTGEYLVSYIEYTDKETVITDKKLTKAELAAMPVENGMVIKPIVEEKILSNDASLKMIKVNDEDLESFDSETLEYNITLALGTTEVPKVEGITSSDKATVTVTDAESLPGTSTIKVTAEDSSEKTYTINFTVEKSNDASLKMIKVNSEELSDFNPETEEYNITLALGTTEVPKVEGITSSDKATVTVTDAESLPGTSTIKVTAEDGSVKTYTINFTVEKSKETGVKEVKVKDQSATVDSENDSIYKLELSEGVKASDIKSEDIEISVKDTNATNTAPTTVDSGQTWTFTVTAEDGETTKDYTIELTEKVEKFTVSFEVDEASKEFGQLVDPQVQEVEKDTPWTKITVPQTQPQEGYKAVWKDFPETVTESAVYRVKFIKDADKWAEVKFNTFGIAELSEETLQVLKGKTLTSTPSVDMLYSNDEFLGWYTKDNNQEKSDISNKIINSDTEFIMRYSRKIDIRYEILEMNSDFTGFTSTLIKEVSTDEVLVSDDYGEVIATINLANKYMPAGYEYNDDQMSSGNLIVREQEINGIKKPVFRVMVKEKPKYTVSYKFESSNNTDLPEKVMNLKLTSTEVFKGTEITPTGFDPVEVADGTWTFEGYSPASATITGPTVFTGTWKFEPNVTPNEKVTVTFVIDSDKGATTDPLSQEVELGTSKDQIKLPQVTPKDGYKFDGWDVDLPKKIEENITLTAVFSTTESTPPRITSISFNSCDDKIGTNSTPVKTIESDNGAFYLVIPRDKYLDMNSIKLSFDKPVELVQTPKDTVSEGDLYISRVTNPTEGSISFEGLSLINLNIISEDGRNWSSKDKSVSTQGYTARELGVLAKKQFPVINKNNFTFKEGLAKDSEGNLNEAYNVHYLERNSDVVLMVYPKDLDMITLKYYNGSNIYEIVKIPKGGKPVLPNPFNVSGFNVLGWYKDAEFTQPMDMNEHLDANTNYYIKTENSGADTSWYSNNPTASEFEISNLSQWNGFVSLVQGEFSEYGKVDFANKTVKMVADIDFTDAKISPVEGFKGTFDGRNNAMQNISFANLGAYKGIFGTIGTGTTIKNLKVVDPVVQLNEDGGVVAGKMLGGTLLNIHITGAKVEASQRSGILSGNMNGGFIYQCSVKNSSIKGSQKIAGIVGIVHKGKVSNCYVLDSEIPNGISIFGKHTDNAAVVGHSVTAQVEYIYSNKVSNRVISNRGPKNPVGILYNKGTSAQVYIDAGYSQDIWNIVDGQYPTLKGEDNPL